MPTSPGKARLLLNKGKAKVVQRDPFTIQLKYATGENKQPIKFGLDTGYKFVGFSAVAQLNRKGFKPSIRKNRYKYSPGDLVKRLSLLQTTGWGEKRDKKDRSTVYTVKGVFNYGEWIRLANPIPGEDDINVDINDAKILKYGSGLLFQLTSSNEQKLKKDKAKDKIKKLSKKEQKIADMKGQKSIDDAWN